MANDKEVKINIATTADTAGAQQAAQSLGEVQKATEAAATATEKGSQATDKHQQSDRAANVAKREKARAAGEASKKLNELGEATEKGAAAGRVFGQIASGNIGYLTQLGAALKALGAAAKANIFGVILIAATALFNLLMGLNERLGLFRKKMEEAGSASEKAAEKVDLFAGSSRRFEKMKDELGELRTQFERVTSAVDALRGATDAVEDAQTALELARIDKREAEQLSDVHLTEEERRHIRDEANFDRSGVRQRADERRAEAQRDRAREKIGLNEQALEANAKEQADLSGREANASRRVEELLRNLARLDKVIAAADADGAPLPGVPDTPDNVRQRELAAKARAEREEIQKQIASGRAEVEKIQAERNAAQQRARDLARQGPALQKSAEAAAVNVDVVRERNAAEARRMANERAMANKAALEAAQPGSTQRPPVPKASPAPREPALIIDGRTRNIERGMERTGRDAGTVTRPPAKDYEAIARATLQPDKDYDKLAAALLGLTSAVQQKAAGEQARIDALTRRVQQAEQQIRNGDRR